MVLRPSRLRVFSPSNHTVPSDQPTRLTSGYSGPTYDTVP